MTKATLLAALHEAYAVRQLQPDAVQQELVQRLGMLADRLAARARSWLKFGPPPRGLYIHGPVGRGKTMVMDLFYQAAPDLPKRRLHFHAFMLEVHAKLHAERAGGHGDRTVERVAAQLAKQARLLCFDEFQVYNIADAMILARLFEALFASGVVMVATSNVAPDDLYRDGLQRSLFLPFIALLKQQVDVFTLAGPRDYRLARLKGQPVYLCPRNAATAAQLQSWFDELTDHAAGTPHAIDVSGRTLHVPKQAHGVAWFGYEELCRGAHGAADFIALAREYTTVIVDDIPALKLERQDELIRFVNLIDMLYEAHRRLILRAEAPLAQLFPAESPLGVQIGRAQSRLEEMQSRAYLNAISLDAT